MKCSIAHRVRDAIRDSGACIADTDHGWAADIEDVLEHRHQLCVEYTRFDGDDLETDMVLHSNELTYPISNVRFDDDCIVLTGAGEAGAVTMCVGVGNWPLIDVSHKKTNQLLVTQ